MPDGAAFPPSSAGGIVLGQSGAAVSHTGDTTETILATIAIPAGLIGANGRVEIRTLWSKTGTAGACVCKAYYGLSGSGIGGTAISNNNIGATTLSMSGLTVFANANAAGTQDFMPGANFVSPYATSSSAISPGSVDTTQACEINITGKLANGADTIALLGYQVLIYPKS